MKIQGLSRQRFSALFWGLMLASSMGAAIAHAETSASNDSRIFRDADVFELEHAGDPQASHHGKQVAYVRTTMDIMTDKARKNIWLLDVSSGDHRPLLSGRDNYDTPVWSPSDDRIAYVSNAEGNYQLYSRWLDTGQTALLSNLPSKPGAVSWSPDGKWLAFTMFVEEQKTPLAKMPAKPNGAEWADPVKEIEAVTYRSDGAGFLKTGYKQIFVLPADGGSARQLSSGGFNYNGPLTWTKNGDRIFFSSNLREDWAYLPGESDIYSIDVANGAVNQLTDRAGPDNQPRLSPDGKWLAYLGNDDRKMGHNPSNLYIMNLASGKIASLTEDFDRSIADMQWAGDNKHLWIQYDDRGLGRIAKISTSGKLTKTDLTLTGTTLGRPYSSGNFSVSATGTIALTVGSTQRPADIAVSDNGQSAQQLTALNEDLFAHKTLALVERMTWQSSHDGLEIEGWLMTPPGFDAAHQYPMILEIHGGPHTAYGPNFSAEAQLYAAAGYVVLYANPRGSTSYGDDFANAIHRNYPGYDYDDLMSGVDAVIERGYVDANNLFVTGGSGGGVLTAWIVGKTDRFRAAVVAKPVINWASFVLSADFAIYFSQYWFDKQPWEDIESYWKLSPLSLVGNVTTPTMLLTGESDYRTPMSETEQYYQALKHRKVDTLMVRIPGASHSIYKRPSNLIAKVNNILAWFARYRQPSERGEK